MDVTKPYEFTGFEAVDVTKPYRFIGFGAIDVPKPYKFIGFGAQCARGSSEMPPGGPPRAFRRSAARLPSEVGAPIGHQ